MQCPECRSETPGSLGRCTRCDAVLPQSEESSWTPQIPGGEPWPPEPWQPEQPPAPAPAPSSQQQDQPWRYNPSAEEERPWVPREEPQQPSWIPREEEPPPQQRPSWAPREEERPSWAPHDEERPWAAPPENPWQDQRPSQPSPPREQSWPPQPSQAPQQQPWNAQGTPPHQQQWSARAEQRAARPPAPRPDAEQWLPDDAPRWRGPLIAGLAAALLTAAIVVGYVFWTKNGDDADPVAQPQTTSDSAPSDDASEEPSQEPSDSEEPSADGDPKAQAEAVDGLLTDMVNSRKKLSSITYTCANKSKDISTFKKAIDERKDQLADAGSLDVGALDQGAEIKKALKDALQASIDSNEEAVTWLEDENGCGGDAAARLKDVTDKATAAKKAFLSIWNPVAEAEGLDARTRETI